MKGCCPFHADKTPSFHVNDTKGVYFCRSACGARGDCFTWLQATCGMSFPEAIEELAVQAGLAPDREGRKRAKAPVVATYDPVAEERENAMKALAAGEFFRRCDPLTGSIAERYLASRGILAKWMPDGKWPPTVRFCGECEWVDRDKDGKVIRRLWRPAIVPVIQAADRHVIGVHRIYLTPDGGAKAGLVDHTGKKADKKLLGLLVGGAVRLGAGGVELDMAEGLETALTVMMGIQAPVWAALSLYNMSAIEFPEHVQAVTKWLDSDESDREAAKKQIASGNERHAKQGLVVRSCAAPESKDWNDVHMAKLRVSEAHAAEQAARSVA